jgi:hypothetical protein
MTPGRLTTSWRLLVALACVTLASQPASVQLWGNLTFDWLKTERLTYSLDFEPKVLVVVPEDQPGWRNLDVSPSVEYAAKKWLDLTGELTAGWTKQTDDVNSIEVTPRVGLRFHLLSRGLPTLVPNRTVRELPPKRRLVVRDYVRVEWRNFFYSDDSPAFSGWRFRNRLEFVYSLNRANITMDGASYLLADWEWFIPLDDPEERFASRQRIRAGLGYRRDERWRFEVLYIWTRSRDATGEPFTTSENIIDFRAKCVF